MDALLTSHPTIDAPTGPAPVTDLVGPGRLLFERLMGRLEHGDLESLLDLFTLDAEVMAFDGVRRGHAEVGRWLAEMLVEQGPGVLVVEDGRIRRFLSGLMADLNGAA